MKHLKFGGSVAARQIQCPPWSKMAEDAPQRVSGANTAADEGTMLHNAMEAIYENDTSVQELLDTGHHYNAEVLTPDLVINKLQPAIEAVDRLMELYEVDDWIVEPFVQIEPDVIGGSIDLLMRSEDKKTVIVLDYKFGFVNVDVEENAQLLFYALAAATDPLTAEWLKEVENVVLAVVQPNENGDVTQLWVTNMDRVDQFETQYFDAVGKTDSGLAPTTGPACKYCPAAVTCPAKTGAALKASRVNEITAEKLAEFLPLAAEVTQWAKDVQKMAHEQLELGVPIEGYKLVHKRASRVWNDAPAVDRKVRKAKKIKITEGFDLKLKSPAQLEKVCKTLDIDFEKNYGPLVSSVSSGTTLAKADDKRAAVLPLAGLEQLNAMND